MSLTSFKGPCDFLCQMSVKQSRYGMTSLQQALVYSRERWNWNFSIKDVLPIQQKSLLSPLQLFEMSGRVGRLQTLHLSFSGCGATVGESGLGVLYLHVFLILFRGNSAPVVSSPGLVMTLQSSDLLHQAKIHCPYSHILPWSCMLLT